MSVPAPAKGTRDFYPEDMVLREYIFAQWRKTCERYGFEEFDAPMFESLSLYTQKSGDEIEKQLYTFTDKGGRPLALRPEMTPSLARMVAARGTALKRPVRWYSIPRLFRYERMQKGRLREFFQLNMDILGIEDELADAELIAAAIDMMRDLGFDSSDFSVHVSSRNLLEELLVTAGIGKELFTSLLAILDRRHKMEPEAYENELKSLLPNPSSRDTLERVFGAKNFEQIRSMAPGAESVKQLSTLFEYLETYGLKDYVEFDIGIVRGLAYYTGIVFELFDKKRSMRAIAGGGRYDKLVEMYGGPTTPAVGFAAGDVVLGELLKEKGTLPTQGARSEVYLICADEAFPREAIRLGTELRRAGISTEFSLKPMGIGKQLKLANTARSRFAVIIGPEELKTSSAIVKDMISGTETKAPLDRLIPMITELK